jgi:hypothetical protein
VRVRTSLLAAVCAFVAACSASGGGEHATARTTPAADYAPHIDAASFSTRINNRYFPLVPGLTYVYEGTSDGKPERNDITITHDTKKVALGVMCVVVHDVVYVGGVKEEETYDWYAQDSAGAVWYFGEDSKEFRPDGTVKSTAGSWEAGVNGAQPGVVMPAHPTVGSTFRQEYRRGVAEDLAKILQTGTTVSVPLSTYKDAIVTKDYTPLEPDQVEHKTYAPGVGFVQSDRIRGGKEHVELVRVISS